MQDLCMETKENKMKIGEFDDELFYLKDDKIIRKLKEKDILKEIYDLLCSEFGRRKSE